MQAPLRIDPLSPAELAPASRLLGRAFRDNALNRAVMPDHGPRARERANAAGLRAQLAVGLRHGWVLAGRERGRLAGLLLAAPPAAQPLPLPSAAEQLRVLLGQGLRVARRWAAVSQQLARAAPGSPHWTLSLLGVEPERQRRGIGTQLLAALLARADAEAAPIALETDLPRNLAFYRRAGFDVEQELRILGAPVWCMRRPARASGPERIHCPERSSPGG